MENLKGEGKKEEKTRKKERKKENLNGEGKRRKET